MQNLSKEYLLLFNVVTDMAESLQQLREELIQAQRQAEELYVSEEEPALAGVK